MRLFLDKLSKSFGDNVVIDSLSIGFKKDNINIIMGPSGAGKTTLLNILSGLKKEDSGQIDNYFKTEKKAYVFQESRLFPFMTVYENIDFVIDGRIDKIKRKQIIEENLEVVGLKDYLSLYPNELSGGMSQRVSLARALAYDAKILFADEPFSAMDLALKKDLAQLIKETAKKKNITVISVTHDIDVALYMGDEIVVFKQKPLSKYVAFNVMENNIELKKIIESEINE